MKCRRVGDSWLYSMPDFHLIFRQYVHMMIERICLNTLKQQTHVHICVPSAGRESIISKSIIE